MATLLGKILADFTTTLSTDLIVGGTSATLSSATDDDGVALPSGRYFFTLDSSNSSKEHISCDLVGTALTNIKSVSRQGVETTGTVRKHRIGATVTLTDFGSIKFMNDILKGTTQLDVNAPLGYDGAPGSLTGNQLATVTYVLGVVNGGAVTFDQQIISNQTSGEAIAINDVVYFKEVDAKWYKADADLTTTFDQLQIGICKTVAGASGVTIQVAISGPVSGFTGLTAGAKYYLSNTAGAITTTAGTNSVFIGWALTTTTLLFNPILKTLPTQKEKDAMVGSQGVVSSTNKYISQDNVTTAGTDQSQTTQNATIETGEANATTKRNKVAQSFTAGKTKVRGVALYKTANTGTFTGTVTVSLQADTAGSPSGTALLTKTLTNAEYNALSVGAFDIIFSSEYSSLVLGTTYWIVIETSTSDTSNHPNLGTNSAGGYAGGSVKSWNTTDGWTAVATVDLYFKTYEGINNQIVSTDNIGLIPRVESRSSFVHTISSTAATYEFQSETTELTIPITEYDICDKMRGFRLTMPQTFGTPNGVAQFTMRLKLNGTTVLTIKPELKSTGGGVNYDKNIIATCYYNSDTSVNGYMAIDSYWVTALAPGPNATTDTALSVTVPSKLPTNTITVTVESSAFNWSGQFNGYLLEILM